MTDAPRATRLPLLFAICAALCGACSVGSTPTAEDYLQRAQSLQAEGAVEGAIIELKNALQTDPQRLEGRWQLGQLYLEQGDGAAAEKELLRAKALGAQPAAVAIALGEALLLQGAHQRLLDEIPLEGAERPEDRAVLLRQRGEATLLLGRSEEGCSLFREAEALGVDHTALYRGLAQCALLDKDSEAASGLLDDALRLDDSDAKTWIALGNLRRADGDLDGAAQAYANAAERDPRRVDALFYRAQIQLQQEQPEAALADAQAIRKQDPRYFGTDFIEAQLAYEASDLTKAREIVERVLAANPAYPPARLMYAKLSGQAGNHEQAADFLRAYLAQVPGDLDARLLLAATYLSLDTPSRARELLNPLIDAGIEEPRLLALGGETEHRLGNPDAAVRFLAAASGQLPDDAGLRTHLAKARLAAGDEQQGVADLEAASALDTQDPRAEINLAYRYLERKEYDEALRVLAIVERKLPESAGPHNLRGLAYLGKGDKAAARMSFERALALQPTLVSAAVRLAQLDLADNGPSAAKRRYLDILELDETSTAAMIGVAEIELHEGNRDAYVDWLTRAASADPKAVTPHLLLAQHYAENGDLPRASALAREAVDRRPNSPHAWALLGDVQMKSSQPADARTSYERLVTAAPRSAAAHYSLATAELALGNDGPARDALRRAIELEPQNAGALRALYDLEKRGGDDAEAGRIAERLRALGIDAETGEAAEGTMRIAISGASGSPEEMERAIAAIRPSLTAIQRHRDAVSSDAEAADAALLGWLAEHPADRLARTYLAGSYLNRKREREAIAQYEAVLEHASADPTALNNLAILYHRINDPRAVQMARKVYELAPDNPNTADTLGWILVQQGDTAEGLGLLERAVRAAPAAAEIRLHLAEALLMTGDADRARTELDQLGALEGLPPDLAEKRGELLDRLGQAQSTENR